MADNKPTTCETCDARNFAGICVNEKSSHRFTWRGAAAPACDEGKIQSEPAFGTAAYGALAEAEEETDEETDEDKENTT